MLCQLNGHFQINWKLVANMCMGTSIFKPLRLTITYVVANFFFTRTHFQNLYKLLYRYKGIQYRLKVSSAN